MRKSCLALAMGLPALSAGCEVVDNQSDGELNVTASEALELAANASGFAETFHVEGTVDRTNPFFTPNDGNGRTCETCHQSDQGWSIIPSAVHQLFKRTRGLDLLFKTHDEGSRPDNDISTLAGRKKAFGSTLLEHAVTRFPLTVTDSAEFSVIAVDDPSGFSTLDPQNIVFFRRSVPTANEAKVAQTNWAFQPSDFGAADVPTSLVSIAIGATGLHLQNTALPVELATQIRDFQLGLFFAQSFENAAGALDTDGAKGGPAHLAGQEFYVGINDIQGNDPLGRPFTREVFDLFDAWRDADADRTLHGSAKKQAHARASIFRGQEIFNSHEFDISGVNGLNDVLGRETVRGTCSTCHNAPNVGGHSVVRFFDIGTANEERCRPVYPMITIQNKATGEIRKLCDLGRAGAGFPPSGHWSDVGAFRAPPLRGLAARAPYFHDGQAKGIRDVIDYYRERFDLDLSPRQIRDLSNFLEAL